MQSIIVVILMMLVGNISIIEFIRDSVTDEQSYTELKVDFVAGNIMQYNDLVYQYAKNNYQDLHMLITSNPGKIEQEKILDMNELKPYNQKNLKFFLDYKTIFFNYTSATTESSPLPTLYLITTWNGFAINFKSNMLEVMGQVNQLFGQHLYQGRSTYWVIPWVGIQNNCNVEIYNQIPADLQGRSRVKNVQQLINKFCKYFENNARFRFDKFIYIQPVYR